MATNISYNPPSLQVIREEVCYRTFASSEVFSGFHVVSYMGEEEVYRKLETLDGKEVAQYELCACPIAIQQHINDKKVLVLQDKSTRTLVYAVNSVNDNGSVNSAYFNIDGSKYTGDTSNLEIASDNLNYTSPVVFCHEGQTVTRTDVWDEFRNLVTVIWQDAIGRIVSEPTGKLHPGACDLPLDTEVISQIDNLLNDGKITGEYVSFYRVNVHDNRGQVVFSSQKLADGSSYSPIGRITVAPIKPPLLACLRRISGGEIWEGSGSLQSISFAIEYANAKNVVEITTPDSPAPVLLNKLNYKGHWAVDGDSDPNVDGVRIKANGSSKVIINWTEQPKSVEVSPITAAPSSTDPLNVQINIPEDLTSN
jgi:hypothetical protein